MTSGRGLKNDSSYCKFAAQYPVGKTKDFIALIIFGLIFYISAYHSVSDSMPTSIPVHHDDYTNYAAGGRPWVWSWIRPLSTLFIHGLAQIGSDWLIWTIRLLTVMFVFLIWKLLCEFHQPAYYWWTLLLFAVGSFSTPIIVEYARYTGMITHLLSGCLGLCAVYFLFREVMQPKQGRLYLSLVFLVLSVLAKEDFVLLYAISLIYAASLLRTGRKRILGWGSAGLGVCMFLIAGAKFMAASSFLGVLDTTSPYYVDASPGGILQTMWRYLVGGGHPAMAGHGLIVAGIFVFSTLAVAVLVVLRRGVPKAAYFLAATLSIMTPYSLLPNHVNAYYELIWLPMLIGCCFIAMSELMEQLAESSPKLCAGRVLISFLVIVGAFTMIDYSRRKGVAAWYDDVATSNENIIKLLLSQKININKVGNVCIVGANSFSPWYMHGGEYLGNVIGLHAKWYIILDADSPFYAGMLVGANGSNGNTILVSRADQISEKCLRINLEELK